MSLAYLGWVNCKPSHTADVNMPGPKFKSIRLQLIPLQPFRQLVVSAIKDAKMKERQDERQINKGSESSFSFPLLPPLPNCFSLQMVLPWLHAINWHGFLPESELTLS